MLETSAPFILPRAPSPCATPVGCAAKCENCQVRLISVASLLHPSELLELESIAHHQILPAKATLFTEGEKADALFTVTAGTVRLQHDLPDGRRQIVGYAIPGDFLGLTVSPSYTLTADTLTQISVCRFERGKFQELVDKRPAMQQRMLEISAQELTLARDHMVLLGRKRAEERVAAFLLGWREKLARIQPVSVTVPLPMGRQDIADHLGLTIETVSRILARWMREKVLLDVPGGVRILNLPALVEAQHA